MEDISTFTNSNSIKYKGMCRLFYIIQFSDTKISPFFDKILRVVIKFIRDEDKEISKEVKKIATILGVHIEAEIYIPTLLTQINELDVSATKSLTSYIVISIPK